MATGKCLHYSPLIIKNARNCKNRFTNYKRHLWRQQCHLGVCKEIDHWRTMKVLHLQRYSGRVCRMVSEVQLNKTTAGKQATSVTNLSLTKLQLHFYLRLSYWIEWALSIPVGQVGRCHSHSFMDSPCLPHVQPWRHGWFLANESHKIDWAQHAIGARLPDVTQDLW